MAKLELKIATDTTPALISALGIFSELNELMSLSAKCLEQGFELRTIDSEIIPAPGASECRTVLEPTDKLLGLVSALRTANGDLRVLVGLPTGLDTCSTLELPLY